MHRLLVLMEERHQNSNRYFGPLALDRVEIQSGTEFGVTLGTPIAMIVRNEDQRPKTKGLRRQHDGHVPETEPC